MDLENDEYKNYDIIIKGTVRSTRGFVAIDHVTVFDQECEKLDLDRTRESWSPERSSEQKSSHDRSSRSSHDRSSHDRSSRSSYDRSSQRSSRPSQTYEVSEPHRRSSEETYERSSTQTYERSSVRSGGKLTLSSLNLPLSSSSTTSRELLSQFSTCSG